MTRIIIGILIVGAGFIMVWRTRWIISLVGRSSFGERTFSGGSYTFYKLIGIGVILLGVVVVVGLQGDLLTGTLGRLYH